MASLAQRIRVIFFLFFTLSPWLAEAAREMHMNYGLQVQSENGISGSMSVFTECITELVVTRAALIGIKVNIVYRI